VPGLLLRVGGGLAVQVRALPSESLAGALGIDLSRFKRRKGGTEWAGPCPVHKPKKNSTAFSYNVDGRFACFSCDAKERGAIDLAMQATGVGFQQAVDFLQPLTSATVPQETPKEAETVPESSPDGNPPKKFTYEKFTVPSERLKPRGLTSETLGALRRVRVQERGEAVAVLRQGHDPDPAVLGRRHRGIPGPRPAAGRRARGVAEVRHARGAAQGARAFRGGQLKEPARLRVISVVESPLCVMKFAQMNQPAVSPFGEHVSQEQAQIISELARGVVYLPDRGMHSKVAESVQLLSARCWVKMPMLVDGVDDPENLTEEQVRNLT